MGTIRFQGTIGRKITPVQRRAPDVDSMRKQQAAYESTNARARIAYNAHNETIQDDRTRDGTKAPYPQLTFWNLFHNSCYHCFASLLSVVVGGGGFPKRRLRGRKLSSSRKNLTRRDRFPHVSPSGWAARHRARTRPVRVTARRTLAHDGTATPFARESASPALHDWRYEPTAYQLTRSRAPTNRGARLPPRSPPAPPGFYGSSRSILKDAQVQKDAWMKKHKQELHNTFVLSTS